VVYAPTAPDPLDASLIQARPELQKAPKYVFHETVGFLNRTVNGQPLLMMREVEQALELNDPLTADQIRRAAAAAAKKPPSYEQLLDLRKHFAKEIQQIMVEDAKEAGTTFIPAEKPLLPAIEHPPFDAFSLAATLKVLGKGAKYSAGQAAMKSMDAFLKEFFRYTELLRQLETVKVSEIQKGLDTTRSVLIELAASLTPNQKQLVERIEGEIAHQQAEINVVASLADAARLIVPQIAINGISLTSGSLKSETIMTGATEQLASLINAGDAQRARTATELSRDMAEAPAKKKPYQKGDTGKAKAKVSDSSGDTADSGAAKGNNKSPAKRMPPPSPRTPTPSKRKPDKDSTGDPKRPKANTPTTPKQPQTPTAGAADAPKGKQPQAGGAGRGKGGGRDGNKDKGNKGSGRGHGSKTPQ